jgi:hypothetical protein
VAHLDEDELAGTALLHRHVVRTPRDEEVEAEEEEDAGDRREPHDRGADRGRVGGLGERRE